MDEAQEDTGRSERVPTHALACDIARDLLAQWLRRAPMDLCGDKVGVYLGRQFRDLLEVIEGPVGPDPK